MPVALGILRTLALQSDNEEEAFSRAGARLSPSPEAEQGARLSSRQG